jgi:hypothetical protein
MEKLKFARQFFEKKNPRQIFYSGVVRTRTMNDIPTSFPKKSIFLANHHNNNVYSYI